MAALVILRREGTVGVLKSAESISAIGCLLYGLVRVGRWWRNVKPPAPNADFRTIGSAQPCRLTGML
jgi:hypothetical protein